MDGRPRLDRSVLDPHRTGIIRPGDRRRRSRAHRKRRRSRRTSPRPGPEGREARVRARPRSRDSGANVPAIQLKLAIAGLGTEGCDVEVKPANPSCKFRPSRASTSRPTVMPRSSCATSSSRRRQDAAPWRSRSASPARRRRRSIGDSGRRSAKPGIGPELHLLHQLPAGRGRDQGDPEVNGAARPRPRTLAIVPIPGRSEGPSIGDDHVLAASLLDDDAGRESSRVRRSSQWPQGTSSGRTSVASIRMPTTSAKPSWRSEPSGLNRNDAKLVAVIAAAEADQAAGVADRPDDPPPQAPLLRLLVEPGHEEDVVIDPDGHQQHEQEVRHLPVEPLGAQAGRRRPGASRPARRRRSGSWSRPG